MCGICGVARHPDGDDVDVAKGIVLTLLELNEKRGSHATGIAVDNVGVDAPWIFKKAIEARKFVKGDPFLKHWEWVTKNTRVILGHTRHATHSNAHQDDAAHPFQVGSVIGAHNGIIRNWREIEADYVKAKGETYVHVPWVNDSQAAFGALDLIKDPVKATDQLDGYFALSWIKAGKLFLCRANSPELSAAYVPSMRALFWSSDRVHLATALQANGISVEKKECDIWTCKPGTIYRYDPTEFTSEGANGTKRDAPFRGISTINRTTRINGANPTQVLGEYKGQATGGYSTTRTVTRTPSGGPNWNSVTGQEEFPLTDTRRKTSLGARNAESEMDRVWDVIAQLNRKVRELEGQVEVAEAEIAHLYTALNESKPEVFDEAEPESPYKEAPTCGSGLVDPEWVAEQVERAIH
jgi:predicted glutamine amidotransferase